MREGWNKVSATHPCPICGKPDWCKVSADGNVALCARVEQGSFKRAPEGGFFHRLNGHSHPAAKSAPPTRPTPTAGKAAKSWATAEDAIRAAGQQAGGELANVWTYHNADGSEAMRVARFNLPDGEKTFRPVHPVKGRWKAGDPPGKLPLYRLPDLAEAQVAFVTEGEKCADAVLDLGLTATCSAHGADSAEKSDWAPLAGKCIVILPDNDEPGDKYRRDVLRLLFSLPDPAKAKVLRLPGLGAGEDVFDWLKRGGDRDTLAALAEKAAWIDPATIIGGPKLLSFSEIEPREVRWLWPGRIPLGHITLLVGMPGCGKSFMTTDLAARLSTGSPWPDGSECPMGSTIFVSAEDDPATTTAPRLLAHAADVARVHLLETVQRIDAEGKKTEFPITLADVAAIEGAIKSVRDCRLIVVDPIGSFLGGGIDSHKDNEVRSVLTPLSKLAEKYRVAVVLVAHRRKAAGQAADDLALGSRAFTGVARATWHLARDPNDKHRRLLLPGKNNLAPEGSGLAFTIGGEPATIRWEKDPIALTADEVLAAGPTKPGPSPEERNAAEEWLRDLLTIGPQKAKDVEEQAKAAGFSWRTVRRAKDQIHVKAYRESFSSGWWWRLRAQGGQDVQPKVAK